MMKRLRQFLDNLGLDFRLEWLDARRVVSSKFKKSNSVQASPPVCHKGTGPFSCIFPKDEDCPFNAWISFDGESLIGSKILIRRMDRMTIVLPGSGILRWFDPPLVENIFTVTLNADATTVKFVMDYEGPGFDVMHAESELRSVQNMDPWDTGPTALTAIPGFGTGTGLGSAMS